MQFVMGSEKIGFLPDHLIVAGWTGRDTQIVQHHIDELAALGVAPPSATPLFYQVSNTLLVPGGAVQVLGDATSGEAEPLLIRREGRLWLGLASDHTDRDLETMSVAASKQVCPKPCAAELWEFALVADHVDQLQLRSWIMEGGDWQLYQDGTLGQIMPLHQLAAGMDGMECAAMLCGTLPAIGGVRPAAEFRAELSDPVRDRTITLQYRTTSLRVVQ